MSDKASRAERAFLSRQRARLLGPGSGAAAPSGAAELVARKPAQLPMSGGKIGYYADFVIYAAILLGLVEFALRRSDPGRATWLVAAIVGAGSWTLLEYLLHRFVFHRVPLIADLHHAHHEAPRAYVSTPTWLSLLVLGGLFLGAWRLLTLDIAFGVVSGLIAGWLWYGIVHHVIHYRRPRLLATALKAASHRHLLHHSPCRSGNYGVTTPLWDYVLGTRISSRTRAIEIAHKNQGRSPSTSERPTKVDG